jgi:single-strand DNA-binding protein
MGALKVSGVCRLGADPDLKFTPSGAAVCSARAIFQDRYLDRQTNEWKDGTAQWVTLTAWRQLAENMAESFKKGDDVVVLDGTLAVREFELRDGGKGYSVDITVRDLGPSIRFHAAKSARVDRQYDGPAAGQGDPWNEPPQDNRQRPQPAQRGTWQGSGQPVNQRQARADQRAAQSVGTFPDEPPFFHRTPGFQP